MTRIDRSHKDSYRESGFSLPHVMECDSVRRNCIVFPELSGADASLGFIKVHTEERGYALFFSRCFLK